jgi:hypothetical protein
VARAVIWASHFKTETIGFSGETGARATITLPLPAATGTGEPHEIVLEAINGAIWRAKALALGIQTSSLT